MSGNLIRADSCISWIGLNFLLEEKGNLKNIAAYGAAVLLLVVTAAGCGSNKKIAAHVNNDVISEDEFFERVQNVDAQQLANSVQQRGPGRAGEYAMQNLISEKLFLQVAAEKKALPSDADVNRYMTLAKKYQQYPSVTLVPPNPFRTDNAWHHDT